MLSTRSKFLKSAEGAIAPYFAIAILPILIVSGFAVDYHRANNFKEQLQIALDSAVLAAARKGEDGYEAEAQKYFALNTQSFGKKQSDATFTLQQTDDGVIYRGEASLDVPRTVSALSGEANLSVAADSEAMAIYEASAQPCIYVLDRYANYALRVNSGADIEAPDCEVHVRSEANWAANFNAGINLNFKRICIRGENTLDNFGKLENVELKCDAADDPYVGKLTAPNTTSCDFSNLNFNGGDITLTPGTYCGWTNFNSGTNVAFEPGVYVLRNGGWNVNGGHWEGEGVTFFFKDTSKIQFNSAISASLRAPTSGPFAKFLFAETEGLNKSDFILNDSKDFDVEGIMYLPSRNVTYNSGSTMYSRKLTMVVNTMTLNHTRWNLVGADGASGGKGLVADLRISK